jgi:uncharacterized protein
MNWNIVNYSLFVLLMILGGCFFLSRYRDNLWSYIGLWAVYALSCLWLAFEMARDIFDALSLAASGIFLGGVILLLISARFAYPKYKVFASFFMICAVLLTGVGIDSFIVEPHWLEVRHESLASSKLTKPLKIVVVSDLQTDAVGDYERQVLQKVLDQRPDMVLFSGDYIQAYKKERRFEEQKLNALLRDLKFAAPMGVFATEGDSEWAHWPRIFEGLPIKVFEKSGTQDNGETVVTGLTLADSNKPNYKPPTTEKFHIVVGHRPCFSLEHVEGDLLVAGHTHGGQVQVPLIGPLVTFSRVPRDWAAGRRAIDVSQNQKLVISRGIGMERAHAPRLRFLCRPEIVVIDVQPQSKYSAKK